MVRDDVKIWLRRGIADFGMAMALFWAVAFFVNGDHNRAHAIGVPKIWKEAVQNGAISKPAGWQDGAAGRAPAGGRAADLDQQQALILLSFAFAMIVAINLAFWRHLRRAYASPRRSEWRRGR